MFGEYARSLSFGNFFGSSFVVTCNLRLQFGLIRFNECLLTCKLYALIASQLPKTASQTTETASDLTHIRGLQNVPSHSVTTGGRAPLSDPPQGVEIKLGPPRVPRRPKGLPRQGRAAPDPCRGLGGPSRCPIGSGSHPAWFIKTEQGEGIFNVEGGVKAQTPRAGGWVRRWETFRFSTAHLEEARGGRLSTPMGAQFSPLRGPNVFVVEADPIPTPARSPTN